MGKNPNTARANTHMITLKNKTSMGPTDINEETMEGEAFLERHEKPECWTRMNGNDL